MLIEFLYELKDSINRHGIRWGVVFALYAVFRKERRNYRLDKRDREHNTYFQAILENQVKILDQLGVEPCADTSTLITNLSARQQEDTYLSSWVERLLARYAARKGTWSLTNWNTRRKKIMERLKSRKLWLAIVGALIPIINQEFELNLDENMIIGIMGLLGVTIAGFAHVDAKKAQKGATNEPTQPTGDSGAAV